MVKIFVFFIPEKKSLYYKETTRIKIKTMILIHKEGWC